MSEMTSLIVLMTGLTVWVRLMVFALAELAIFVSVEKEISVLKVY